MLAGFEDATPSFRRSLGKGKAAKAGDGRIVAIYCVVRFA